jgi:hypothetical protein
MALPSARFIPSVSSRLTWMTSLCTLAPLCANKAGALASAIGSMNANIRATNFQPLNMAVSRVKICETVEFRPAIYKMEVGNPRV